MCACGVANCGEGDVHRRFEDDATYCVSGDLAPLVLPLTQLVAVCAYYLYQVVLHRTCIRNSLQVAHSFIPHQLLRSLQMGNNSCCSRVKDDIVVATSTAFTESLVSTTSAEAPVANPFAAVPSASGVAPARRARERLHRSWLIDSFPCSGSHSPLRSARHNSSFQTDPAVDHTVLRYCSFMTSMSQQLVFPAIRDPSVPTQVVVTF
jgi:hypothetical protein